MEVLYIGESAIESQRSHQVHNENQRHTCLNFNTLVVYRIRDTLCSTNPLKVEQVDEKMKLTVSRVENRCFSTVKQVDEKTTQISLKSNSMALGDSARESTSSSKFLACLGSERKVFL